MGILITVEGGEFTGKTTVVVPAIVQFFKSKNIPVTASREPGGTSAGEAIREKIFSRIKEKANALEMALLFNEARKIHLDEIIIPALGAHKEKRAVVVLDRYLDSTRVYQGLEGGVPLSKLREFEKKYAYNYFPDLTFILYFPEEKFTETFLSRKQKASQEVRDHTAFDEGEAQFHLARQRYYMNLPELARSWNETRNFFLIDASKTHEEVVHHIIIHLHDIALS